MKVNDPNLSSLGNASLGTTGVAGTQQAGQTSRSQNTTTGAGGLSDDVHLSELVRSLRSLAADSPERQAKIEQLARSYASGTYQVDPKATASKIVDDAFES
jgi:flagellar biosynthesis anti-sigma factor FlgM